MIKIDKMALTPLLHFRSVPSPFHLSLFMAKAEEGSPVNDEVRKASCRKNLCGDFEDKHEAAR